MKVWLRTDGLPVMKLVGLGGVTWAWFSESCNSFAVVEWNARCNLLQVSVAFGEYLSVAEWFPLERSLGPWALEEHILTAQRQWLERHMDALLSPSVPSKRSLSALALMELTDALSIPAE